MEILRLQVPNRSDGVFLEFMRKDAIAGSLIAFPAREGSML